MARKATDSSSRLAAYRRKRRFEDTPEPADRGRPSAERARFVVHEHHARRLHWDLRLERDGVLASWAIPNGIPEDPKHNRKAVHVEDHPLSYLDFHGTIPQGSYGAGEVTIWDSGAYECEKWRPDEVIVVFDGERLRGRYVLFRAGGQEKDWMIHRMDPPVDPDAQEMPERLEPMLARLSTLPAHDSEWAFEVKWDGVRAIARSRPGRLALYSRNGNEVTGAYPELRALNQALGSHAAMLDGEIVAFDEHGRPSFEALQPRMHQRSKSIVRRLAAAQPVTYMIFDLLWLDGHDLTGVAYRERRELLSALVLDGERWQVPDYHLGDGAAMLEATREQGLEGVVAKRLTSLYTPGRRSGEWLKLKHSNRQETVIGGWSEGQGSRAGRVGALDLGVYEDGELRYAGQVGSGFDEPTLASFAELFSDLARERSPFSGRQPPRGTHFLEPTLVCEVEFSGWTKDGMLRHARYKGLREDTSAREVLRERAQPPPEPARPSPERGSCAARGARSRRAKGAPSRARSKAQRPSIAALIAAGNRVRGGVEIELEGRSLKLTNLDKALYPEVGFTKGDVIDYYAAIAPVLLPHLAGRPLTLKRYPDGVEGEFFYEKQCPTHRPPWVATTPVPSERERRTIDYCLCEDLATLVWLANLADLELHPSLSLAQPLECPTTLAFDLDPGAPAGILECCSVALELRDLFAELQLRAFAKTSGAAGMQVYVPLNDQRATYADTKSFAHAVADVLERRDPQLVVSHMGKARRRGKVLIDWSQNDEHKTTVCVYSLRALSAPSVSTPLRWEEVERCRARKASDALRFGVGEALERVEEHGDLFAEVLSLRQSLPEL